MFDAWSRLSLANQFLAAASLVVGATMLIMGAWVTSEIERGVVRNTAAATALYVDSWIAPHLQELQQNDTLSPQASAQIDALFAQTPLGEKVRTIVIWLPNGRIAYSNVAALIGTTSAAMEQQQRAWQGDVIAEFGHYDADANELNLANTGPMLEIYAPVRSSTTRNIFAVTEFYENGEALEMALRHSRWNSWLLVATTTLAMLAMLFGIVRNGSRTISRQRQALEVRVGELSSLIARNEELSRTVALAHRRTAESNEMLLGRIGVELHDGPAQLLGLALLRLHLWRQALAELGVPADAGSEHANVTEKAMLDCLKEVRTLSAGLTLPDIMRLGLAACLQKAADLHEERTGSIVTRQIGAMPAAVPAALQTCLYRFAQEGLNNAFRHAAGKGQVLQAQATGSTIEVAVDDSGPGFASAPPADGRSPLGLVGLRNRIESLGGQFEISSKPGAGTRLTARFNIANWDNPDG